MKAINKKATVLLGYLLLVPIVCAAIDQNFVPFIEPALTEYFKARSYIPNKYNRLDTEFFRLDEIQNVFSYNLRIAKLETDYNNENNPDFALFDDYKIEGKIESINREGDVITIQISGTSILTSDYMTFYGTQKERSVSVLNIKQSVVYTIGAKLHEEESPYYHIGTQRAFTPEDIHTLSIDELGYLRNEFFARRGYIFLTDKMRAYFSSKSWYKPTTSTVNLPIIEAKNVEFIREIEKKLSFGSYSSDIEKINNLYALAQKRLLTELDLKELTKFELPYLRNTFYARKGLIFYLLQFKDYFEKQAWYLPKLKNVDHLLSEWDQSNIHLIQKLESK